MKPILMRSLMLFALLHSCTVLAEVTIENAWIRLLPPVAKSTAAYMDISSTQDDSLIAVSSKISHMTQIHQTRMDDGVMNMSHIERIAIPANQAVKLSPGGLHIMLMGLHQPLSQTDTPTLTLQFEKAGEITISVPVR